MINYYVILEIPNFSEESIIKKAYRTLSKKYHPDVNKDPISVDYFLKINEAYDFLMNENKRLLLNQFLISAHQKQTFSQPQKTQETVYRTPQKSIIHYFSTDRKNFTLHDYILIQWNVSQCKSVFINVIGNVNFSGTHYLKIEHFIEELVILMTVVGLDDIEYKFQIKLFYHNENPALKAFHEMLLKNPETKSINFKQEKLFYYHARLSKNEFNNRIILLLIILATNSFFYISANYKYVMFIVLGFNLWLIYVQIYKRMHDIEHLKNDLYKLWIPIYNLYVFKDLISEKSENAVNEFGMKPDSKEYSFINWIKKEFRQLTSQLSLLQKVSFSAYFFIFFLISVKSIIKYEEIPVALTHHYTDSSKPTSNSANRSYFLVFDERIAVEVSESQYTEIIQRKSQYSYAIGINNQNETQYLNTYNKQTKTKDRLNLGILANTNPIIILLTFIFFGQLYAWKNLDKPNEKAFANGFMVFALILYTFVILNIIF